MYSGDLFGQKHLYVIKNATNPPDTPALACYCKSFAESRLSLITEETKNHTINYNGKTTEEPICETYRSAQLTIFMFRYIAIFALILTAHKLRLVVEHTVEKLGTDNGASSGAYVIFTVFFC